MDEADAATKEKANDLVARMENSTTLVSLFVVNWLSMMLEPVVKKLQTQEICSEVGIKKMKTLIQVLKDSKRKFPSLYEKAQNLANSIGMAIRMNRNQLLAGLLPVEYWENKIFEPCLTTLIKSMEQRVDQAASRIANLATLFDRENLSRLEELKPLLIDDAEIIDKFTFELDMFEAENGSKIKPEIDILRKLDDYPISKMIVSIINTIPASNADSERAFSRLKIIKSDLRSTMGQDRLSSLAVISMNRGSIPKANEVVQKFFRVKEIRVKIN